MGPGPLERVMKRQEVILKVLGGYLNWIQASEILGISARQMRRLKREYEEGGFPMLVDNRHGKLAWNRAPIDVTQKVLSLYRDQYFDLNVTHFCEKLSQDHGIARSYSWVKKLLHEAGLVAREKKRGKHRKRRERKPLTGMMLHLDGSRHRWFGTEKDALDLLVVLDDATGEIYSGEFAMEEDTRSVFSVLRSVVEEQGIFCSLYTDRASHFAFTPKAGGAPDKSLRTQCQRALDQLGIRLILAMSAQARGRGERAWRTIQGRLPQELRLRGITDIVRANKYLKEEFIPQMKRLFTVPAKETGTAFTEVLPGFDLDKIFSKQYERQVRNDNTISFKNKILQIPESSVRHHFVRCTVTVYDHHDQTLSIGYGPKTIGRYTSEGALIPETTSTWVWSDSSGLAKAAQRIRPARPRLPDAPLPPQLPLAVLAGAAAATTPTPQIQGRI